MIETDEEEKERLHSTLGCTVQTDFSYAHEKVDMLAQAYWVEKPTSCSVGEKHTDTIGNLQ